MDSRRTTGMEFKVGVTAGVALLLLAVTILTVEKIQFGRSGYPIFVSFQFVDAIKPQADVVIGGGVKIGHVADIEVKGERIRLKVMLDSAIRLPKDAKFQILSKGLMGDKYLNVVAQPQQGGETLKENDDVEGIEPTNMDKAFQRLGQVADSIKVLLGDPLIKTSLGEMMRNLGSLSYRLDQVVQKNEVNLNRSFQNISDASKDIRQFSKDFENITHELNGLLSEQNQKHINQTLERLHSLSTRLDQQAAKLDKTDNAMGLLLNDKQMADDLKLLVKELKENPWKLLWKK